ncbi:TraR/DksA family transcriptional regulator [Patescibacteria group bacterium]|nr:TraR/DksA family transcriptional regulator [Patescibacteria group bacterium]
MTKDFLSLAQEKLKQQKEKIEKQLSEMSNRNRRNGSYSYEVKFPEYGRSDDENANEVADFVDSVSLSKNLENSLKEIESALGKINKGKYGLCESCGKKIEQKRLTILPTARYCLVCKKNKK